MTARAESIMTAVKTAVSGLATTGNSVVRGRVWSTDATNSLSVDMGSEEPASAPNVAYQDNFLGVEIVARVKAAQGSTDTQLNQIHAEVYAALMAAPQLGLSYVFRTIYMGRSAPQGEPEEKAASMQTLRYRVHYRHSATSAET